MVEVVAPVPRPAFNYRVDNSVRLGRSAVAVDGGGASSRSIIVSGRVVVDRLMRSGRDRGTANHARCLCLDSAERNRSHRGEAVLRDGDYFGASSTDVPGSCRLDMAASACCRKPRRPQRPPPLRTCHPAYSPCLPDLPGDAFNRGDPTAGQKPLPSMIRTTARMASTATTMTVAGASLNRPPPDAVPVG